MSNYGNPPQDPYGQQQNPYGTEPTAPYGSQPTTPYGGGQPPGGSYPAYGGQGGSFGGPEGTSGKGFLASLFDFSFTSFITPKVVKFVYALSVGLGTLFWVIAVIAGFAVEPVLGLLYLVFGPIFLIFWFAIMRMTLEFYVAVVRMSEDIHQRLR